MTELYHNRELSPSQKAHWERVLENAEKQANLARRMLGMKVVGEIVEVKNE